MDVHEILAGARHYQGQGRIRVRLAVAVHLEHRVCVGGSEDSAIRAALPAFEQRIKGFAMPDAVLTGVETRTSSPLRITRGRDFQSLNVRGLYPAGEGASYAGGILSAGVDGIKVAEAVARSMAARAG